MAAMSYRASVAATLAQGARVRSDDGRLDAALSTPVELGGAAPAEGTNAEQLLAAGYAACFLSALRYVAVQRGDGDLPGDAQVTATVQVDQQDRRRFGGTITLDVQIPSLGEAAGELIEAAQQAWPYADYITPGQPVSVNGFRAPEPRSIGADQPPKADLTAGGEGYA